MRTQLSIDQPTIEPGGSRVSFFDRCALVARAPAAMKTRAVLIAFISALPVTLFGACGNRGPVPERQPTTIPEDAPLVAETIFHPAVPSRFSRVLAWAQAVTLRKSQPGEPASLQMDYLRLLEQDSETGVTRIVAEESFDRDRSPLPCLPGGSCEGALYGRVPWFAADAHSEMFNSFVMNGALHVDLARTPRNVAHWWTKRIPVASGKRYVVESRLRIHGKAAVQFGVDYCIDDDATFNGFDRSCRTSNNCEAFVSDWTIGDTRGEFVVKKAPKN